LRTSSFIKQIEYLENVFNMIHKNDDLLIQTYLRRNYKASYEWCVRFKVPIHTIP
jgi:hypothetical protein